MARKTKYPKKAKKRLTEQEKWKNKRHRLYHEKVWKGMSLYEKPSKVTAYNIKDLEEQNESRRQSKA
jgi:hypothetical protein